MNHLHIYEKFLLTAELNEGATDEQLAAVAKDLGFPLPDDFLDFLRLSNGAEGFLGERYLILWKAEELKEFNIGYEVGEYAPGLLLFGSNGGGEGFAFDTRGDAWSIVQVPFIGMELRYVNPLANSFSYFLASLE